MPGATGLCQNMKIAICGIVPGFCKSGHIYVLHNENILHNSFLQSAGITMYYIMKETKYSQTVLHVVHAAVETSNVNHNSVISMGLVVMRLVTLITIPLIVVTLIFRELVSMSSLNHVTLKNFLLLFLMVPTIHMCPVLIQ